MDSPRKKLSTNGSILVSQPRKSRKNHQTDIQFRPETKHGKMGSQKIPWIRLGENPMTNPITPVHSYFKNHIIISTYLLTFVPLIIFSFLFVYYIVNAGESALENPVTWLLTITMIAIGIWTLYLFFRLGQWFYHEQKNGFLYAKLIGNLIFPLLFTIIFIGMSYEFIRKRMK